MLLKAIRRRWILACVLFLFTLTATAAALFKLPWTYQSAASVVFLASRNTAKLAGGNPYLAFNSTLNQTADVVRYEMMDVRTANFLAAHGYSGVYMISDAIDTPGPVLNITVTGPNKAVVEHTLYGVTREITRKLTMIQAGLSPNNIIHDMLISFTPQATVLHSKKARPLVAVFALGLIFTLGITQVVDAVLVRRGRVNETTDSDDLTPSRPASVRRRTLERPAQAGNRDYMQSSPRRHHEPEQRQQQTVGRGLRR